MLDLFFLTVSYLLICRVDLIVATKLLPLVSCLMEFSPYHVIVEAVKLWDGLL